MRPILYIDLDNVVYDTVDTIKSMYDEDFRLYSGYIWMPTKEVKHYDFSELKFLTPEKLNDYFRSGRFFDRVTCLENAEVDIAWLNLFCGYPITFVSIGNPENIEGKSLWVESFNRAWGTGCEFIGTYHWDKSKIDMTGGILIDDEIKNLQNNSAQHSICFGNYMWNADWRGVRVDNWKELKEFLMKGGYDIVSRTETYNSR